MQTRESIGRDLLRLVVWYPVRWFILIMPARNGIALLKWMGDLHYYVVGRSKSAVLAENLKRIGGKTGGIGRVIRTYFQNHYLDQLFPLIFPKFTADNINQYVTIQGLFNLDNALKKGKGVVLVHGHLGPVHLPLVALALKGYPMKQVGNPTDEGLSWVGRKVAFRLRMKYEKKIPAQIIKTGSFLRPVFQALNNNQVVMITGDGSGRKERLGKQARFIYLGQSVQLPLGPSLLAIKTGAPLIPLFIVPGEKTDFSVVIEKEIPASGIGEQGAVEQTGIFAELLEGYILNNPGYMHFLDRFSPGLLIDLPAERNV